MIYGKYLNYKKKNYKLSHVNEIYFIGTLETCHHPTTNSTLLKIFYVNRNQFYGEDTIFTSSEQSVSEVTRNYQKVESYLHLV